METDGHPAVVAEEAREMEEIARRCGAVTCGRRQNAEEAARLATARRSAFSALARVSPTTILEDATVPRSELAKMIGFIQEDRRRHRCASAPSATWATAICIRPSSPTNAITDEMERVEMAMQEIFDYAIAARRHDHRRTRRRPGEEEISAQRDRRREPRR